MIDVIPVHQLGRPERWFLAELFTEESHGVEAVHVGRLEPPEATTEDGLVPAATDIVDIDRYAVAQRLCSLGLCRWLSADLVAFTPTGRAVAETVVERLLFGRFARAS